MLMLMLMPEEQQQLLMMMVVVTELLVAALSRARSQHNSPQPEQHPRRIGSFPGAPA